MMAKDSRRSALIGCALFALALLGFFTFPGHTYLQSDTQIYIPIFERLENPRLYERDILLTTAHVGLTVYDETAIALHRITRTNYEAVLVGEQILFRALALWGVFLIATGLGLADAAAVMLAACYGLGATIVGPAVLSVEYEPVPRGFAVAFLLLATGLLIQGRYTWACAAASVGFLYHSPSTLPFWILFAYVVVRERRWKACWPLGTALLLLGVTYLFQRNQMRPQPFWASIDPAWEQIVRMRTAYDWIDQWPANSVLVFVLYCAAALFAVWRLGPLVSPVQRLILAGFPVIGVLSIGVSYVLLDLWKWAPMAQVQPARATLFTIVFAQINCGLAAFVALRNQRWAEALAWTIPVFLPPVIPNPSLATWPQLGVVLALMATAATFVKVRWLAAPAVVLLAGWAIPQLAGTINYPSLHTRQLDELAEWARTQTPGQALFVFPNSKRNLEQGVFRAKSLRSLYADWKAGGQVNYFRDFALEWRKRWTELSAGSLTVDDWRARGVEYLIYGGPRHEQLGEPVYENSGYRAYRIQLSRNAP